MGETVLSSYLVGERTVEEYGTGAGGDVEWKRLVFGNFDIEMDGLRTMLPFVFETTCNQDVDQSGDEDKSSDQKNGRNEDGNDVDQ